jgi:protein tyrosine/serine phosphatase
MVSRNALLNQVLSNNLISAILIVLDTKNTSIYIHCLDGRRITGLLVLLIRKLQGWTPSAAFTEYWNYQNALRPTTLTAFDMEKMTKEISKFIVETTNLLKFSSDCIYPRYFIS